MGGNVEIPPGTEMQSQAVNKVQKSRNGEKEGEVLQSLSILGFVVVNNAKE